MRGHKYRRDRDRGTSLGSLETATECGFRDLWLVKAARVVPACSTAKSTSNRHGTASVRSSN